MIIDCHYHLEPRIQSIDNLIQKMDEQKIDKTALMPTMWDVPPSSSEISLKLLRFLLTHRPLRKIAKKLVANFTEKGDIILPKETVRVYTDPDNATVARAMADHPDRFLGWIFVNPEGKNDPIHEYEKYKNFPGFIGIKAHPFWHRYPPKMLLPIGEKAQAENLPLLIHAGFDDHGDFEPLVKKLPDLKLILAHAGFPGFSDTWKKISHNPNVFLDLSADVYVNARTIKQVVNQMGVDRCLFGTDGPYGHEAFDNTFDNGFIKKRIEKLFPGKADREKLLGGNFKRLIGI